ncbi:MAG: glycosyltransferase [Streptosporangiaceae bacterium]
MEGDHDHSHSAAVDTAAAVTSPGDKRPVTLAGTGLPGGVTAAGVVDLAGLSAPVTVAEIELSEPVTVTHVSLAGEAADGAPRPAAGDEPAAPGGNSALVLARLHAMPLGTITVEAPGGIVPAGPCATAAWAALRPALGTHLHADGLAAQPPVPGPEDGWSPPCWLDESVRSAARRPMISVLVATRERPGTLAACLDSLARLDFPDYEVLVIDNDPVTDATARLVASRADGRLRYVRELRRGLAAAHNRGLALADGDIVACTDDDVIADRRWLTEIARAFALSADVGCVTGLIMPAELQTPAQLMLEAHGQFGKGFRQRIVSSAERPADPLFPFSAGQLGSGANMAFRRDSLRAAGGFDPVIGAGTVARGGDDLAAFFTMLAAGHSLVYQPSALVWHRHRRDAASLAGQAYGYGVGLGAYLTAVLVRHPRMLGQALQHAPAALRYAFDPASPRNARTGRDWPRELTRQEHRGLLFGPVAYGLSRWRARGADRAASARPGADDDDG